MSQQAKDFKKFADNLRKTALGVRFTKTIFTNPSSISAKQATQVLKTLGYKIPEGVEVAVDAAQIITSGQAAIEGYQAATTANEINASVNAGASATRALTSIAEDQNLIDSDSASLIKISTSVAMIVASGGTDVKAWVSLCLDLASVGAGKQALANYEAIMNAQEKYRGRITPQAKILGDTFKDFQEKKISIYGVIAKMAVETPDVWPQVINPQSELAKVFPDLLMIPVVNTSVSGKGDASLWGDYPWPAKGRYVIQQFTASKSISFQTIGKNFTKEESAETFFELLIKPWVTCYAVANEEITAQGNMSMSNIAALSYMFNPSGEISDRDNYVNMLIGSCLTPYDFGDPILENIADQFLDDYYKGKDITFKEQAVSFKQSSQNKLFTQHQMDLEEMRRKLLRVQQNDDIVELAQYPYIYKKLQSYMDFQQVSFEKDPSMGGKLTQKFSTQDVRAWRKLHNYIAVINMIDTFRRDSYLSQTRFAQNLLPFMPSVDHFQKTVDRINFLSTGRAINRLAKANIASFVGTTTDKLKWVNQKEIGPAIYTIK